MLVAVIGFDFGGLGRNRLIEIRISQLQMAEQVQEQGVLFGREIAFGFLMQSVEHIDEFACGFGIDHGLAGARVGVGAEDHGGVAAKHADEVLESGDALRSLRGGWRSGCFCSLWWRRGWDLCSLTLGFPLLLLDHFPAQFPFSSKRTAVDYAKRFILFMVGQGTFLSDWYHLQFITGCQRASLRRAAFECASPCQRHGCTLEWKA